MGHKKKAFMNGDIGGVVAATFLTGIVIRRVSGRVQPVCEDPATTESYTLALHNAVPIFKMASNLA